MQVELKRVNNAYHFMATGSSNIPVQIDANKSIGGVDAGARPMELILMGLAGCSAIDIITILNKQKQQIDKFDISVDAKRREEEIPAVFEKINIHLSLSGNLQKEKVQRAIDLSMEKYCSVTAMLRPTVEITTSFVINEDDDE
jgi:putative redox protein